MGRHHKAEEHDDEGGEGVAGDGVGFRGCPVGFLWEVVLLGEVGVGG